MFDIIFSSWCSSIKFKFIQLLPLVNWCSLHCFNDIYYISIESHNTSLINYAIFMLNLVLRRSSFPSDSQTLSAGRTVIFITVIYFRLSKFRLRSCQHMMLYNNPSITYHDSWNPHQIWKPFHPDYWKSRSLHLLRVRNSSNLSRLFPNQQMFIQEKESTYKSSKSIIS